MGGGKPQKNPHKKLTKNRKNKKTNKQKTPTKPNKTKSDKWTPDPLLLWVLNLII